jgi:hypothetical protein
VRSPEFKFQSHQKEKKKKKKETGAVKVTGPEKRGGQCRDKEKMTMAPRATGRT